MKELPLLSYHIISYLLRKLGKIALKLPRLHSVFIRRGQNQTAQSEPLPFSLQQDKTGAKKLEDKLKADPQLKEASRATILECDDTECATAQCTQDRQGNWSCEGGLE